MSRADDVIDFRDLTDRLEELEDKHEDHKDHGEEWDEDEAEELAALVALLDEVNGYGGDHQWRGDWYPGFMIRDDHFEEYARELADDIGAINRDASWPSQHIDWKAAAEHLQLDYSDVEFMGSTYWYR